MNINPIISEWLNFIARWTHVFAGIMWVGTTYYFTWLDARLSEEEKAANATGTAAQIWMVHSGGFYLLVLMFYLGGGALVDPDVSTITVNKAIILCLGLLIFGWVVYDLLML